MENLILSPAMLWRDFDAAGALKESKTGEETFDDIVYSDVYFNGRETDGGRVRIYGIFARSRAATRKSLRGAVLILPDMSETVDVETVNLYVKQGYTVLMVDYRGAVEGVENYTRYPDAVSYANYERVKDKIDAVPMTAKETCWYEWAAVAKYAISFLAAQFEIEKIGVLGIRNGANVGWILCGTDARISCFVPLFGAGWRAYKGINKNSGKDVLQPDDEKLRFLAAVDAHAYAQYVRCPVFYMTATNSPDFDVDRSADTIVHLPDDVEKYINYTPMLRDALDSACKRNVNLFFAKHLLNFKAVFPEEPKFTATIEGNVLTCDVDIDFSDIKRPKTVNVYVAEDGVDPTFREWKLARLLKGLQEDRKSFAYELGGNCNFINAFAVVEYKNGITVSSKMICKKTAFVEARTQKMLYETRDKLSTFTVYDVKNFADGKLFFDETKAVTYEEAASGIFGVTTPYGLVTYKPNKRNVTFTDRSLVKFDVYCVDYAILSVSLMVSTASGVVIDYVSRIELRTKGIWQNVLIKINDFKSESGLPLRDYDNVVGMRFSTETKCVFNNLLIL